MSTAARRTPSLARCAHAVIFVVKANDLYSSDGKYRKTFRMTKGHLHKARGPALLLIIYTRRLGSPIKEDLLLLK